jgi:hypothetical protein
MMSKYTRQNVGKGEWILGTKWAGKGKKVKGGQVSAKGM